MIRSSIVTVVTVSQQCGSLLFSMAASYGREGKVLQMYSVLITSVPHLTGQVSIVAARYYSIVVAFATVTVLVLVF